MAAGLELSMGHTVNALLRQVPRQQPGPLQALGGATTWLNTLALDERALRGRTVLVNFCTYTCINWLRQLPYVRAWEAKYRPHGLVVIGAHTPEFAFEHRVENVRQALAAMRVTYPVAIDNGYDIWKGFENHYWPALYLIDAAGKLQYRQFGEGEYDRTERWIQKLLAERGAQGFDHALVEADSRGIEAGADWKTLQSPENYLGSSRTDGFTALGDNRSGYRVPDRLRLNQWALGGGWTINPQAVVLTQPRGRIVSRFHARDLHLVMGPVNQETSIRFRVRVDGQAPGAAHGLDIDEQGAGTVTEQRLYQLLRQPGRVDDRNFEIEFLDAGVEAYAFTFG
ncbi:MAG TPA: redoxin family protein [Gemmatimonadales bacterium]|nr:redoxin family protein [Gemmatimonadales bacterium]